ncbi:hypothetical protein BC2230_120103 [Burkholderia cepacia]
MALIFDQSTTYLQYKYSDNCPTKNELEFSQQYVARFDLIHGINPLNCFMVSIWSRTTKLPHLRLKETSCRQKPSFP